MTDFFSGTSRYLWLALIIPAAAVLGSVNFTTCLAEVRAGKWGLTGGTDAHGRPIGNISEANAITYELCVVACGTGQEPFKWQLFSEQFSGLLRMRALCLRKKFD
jgi:hypothetical protein